MKFVATAAMALAVGSGPATAAPIPSVGQDTVGPQAAAPVHFFGSGKITAQSGDCKGVKFVGTGATMRFMPGGFPDKLPGAFTIFGGGETHAYVLPSGKFTRELKSVKSLYVALGWAPYGKTVKIAVTSTTPAVIRSTTKNLKATIKLKGFSGLTGCVLTIAYSGVKAS